MKPKFDPSKPFDAATESAGAGKPKFDPSQPFDTAHETEASPTEDHPSALSDVLRTANQGVPGYGLLQKAGNAIGSGIVSVLPGEKRSFGEIYDQNLKADQKADSEAFDRHPVLGTAAMIAEGGVAKAPASFAGRVLLNAADAGTRGEGLWDNTSAAIGAGTTAATEGLMKGVSALAKTELGQKLASKGVDLAEWLRDKIGHAGFGVNPDATAAYLENPESMRKTIAAGTDRLEELKNNVDNLYNSKVSQPYDQAERGLGKAREDYAFNKATLANTRPPESLATDIVAKVKDSDRELSRMSGEAFEKLDGVTFDRNALAQKVEDLKSKLMIDGRPPVAGDRLASWNALGKVEDMINATPETRDSLTNQIIKGKDLDGASLKQILQTLDDMSGAAYTTYGTRTAAGKIKGIRSEFDGVLKDAAPEYAEAMKPLAEKTELVSQLKDVFGSEETARAMLLKASNPDTGKPVRDLLAKVDKVQGTDFASQVEGYIQAQRLLKNPQAALEYRQGMLGSAENAFDKAKDAKSFFNRVGPGQTESTLKSVSTGVKNFEGRKQIEELGGPELLKQVEEYGNAQSFLKPTTNGARRAVTGAAIGSSVGGPVGMAVGAGTGYVLDVAGGKLWQKILDGGIKASELAETVGPQFRQVLEHAERQGPRVLAATYFAIKNKDQQK